MWYLQQVQIFSHTVVGCPLHNDMSWRTTFLSVIFGEICVMGILYFNSMYRRVMVLFIWSESFKVLRNSWGYFFSRYITSHMSGAYLINFLQLKRKAEGSKFTHPVDLAWPLNMRSAYWTADLLKKETI